MRSPDGHACTKTIHPGWTVDEGHGGGHFWVGAEVKAIFDGGHHDATGALSMQPFDGHRPEDCPGETCPYRWRLDLAKRVGEKMRGLRPGGGKWDAVRDESGRLVDRQMDCTQPLPGEANHG